MGTRCDFYIDNKGKLEWLGSLAWDGYPEGINAKGLLTATTERGWRGGVHSLLTIRDDVTKPHDGWPWPWGDSSTTNFAYIFVGGKVLASCFGGDLFDPVAMPECPDNTWMGRPKFPDMSAHRKLAAAGSERSGVMVVAKKENEQCQINLRK